MIESGKSHKVESWGVEVALELNRRKKVRQNRKKSVKEPRKQVLGFIKPISNIVGLESA